MLYIIKRIKRPFMITFHIQIANREVMRLSILKHKCMSTKKSILYKPYKPTYFYDLILKKVNIDVL